MIYDNTANEIQPWTERKAKLVNPADRIRIDLLAKEKLAPFMLDIALLSMVEHMDQDTLMSAYHDFKGVQDSEPVPVPPTSLTNLRDRVVKDESVPPFILVW